MAAPVPFSQLKPYKYYIVPTPSDEARFLTETYATNADEYVKQQRRLLLNYVGRRMHLLGNRDGTWNAQLHRDDNGKVESTYFDESSFPPGQLFQEVGYGWKPSELAPMPPDLWDEFIAPQDMDFASYDEELEYQSKIPKLTDVLSQADIDAQKQFSRTIKPDEARALNAYKAEAYSFMGPLMAGMPEHSLGVVHYARQETRADSKDPARPPLPKERPGPGFIQEFMAGFNSALSKAPKLTQELNVFRGIGGKEGLNINGKMVMSTSYDKHVAFTFSGGKGACCMLKINVKPGVRIFAWEPPDPESEIMILPPYKAQIEDVGDPDSGIKKVTITPAKYRGGTRRRGNRRRTRLRQTKKLTSKL
jgi:hypothetical protein